MNNPRSIEAVRRVFSGVAAVALLAVFAGAAATPVVAADDATPRYFPPPWGFDTVAGGCVVCHSLESGGPFRVAPNLYGIVGAEEARARAWYAYSPALLAKGGTWTKADLDRFLADANAFAPGTKKSIHVRDPEQRRLIIEFLKTLKLGTSRR
jgi:cytochrome c